MPGELAKRHCRSCSPGTPPIDLTSAEKLFSQVDAAWLLDSNLALRRDFKFRNFRDAFGFATRLALLAEEQGHHPDLELGWGYVNVILTTHVAKGLTDNDFIMAAKIDKIAEREPLKQP